MNSKSRLYQLRAAGLSPRLALAVRASAVIFFVFCSLGATAGQAVTEPNSNLFRIGEKLSYTVSFENVKDAAYFETAVVSRGKLGVRDVVEIRARAKTFDIVSAALALIDERRTVFADPESGSPVMTRKAFLDQVLPRETVTNFPGTAASFDLLTLLYALRASGGNGTFSIAEDGESSIITAKARKKEHISSDLGEYDTIVSTLTGPYLDTRGISKLRVNITISDVRLPVLIQFTTPKGSYRAVLTAVTDISPESTAAPDVTPVPTPVTLSVATPKPVVTSTPYIDNQPLLPELSFDLGETLQYRLSRGGRAVGTLTLSAPERKQLLGRDALRLVASFSGVEASNGVIASGDLIRALVNPDTLAPFQSEMRFGGSIRNLSQTLTFDPRSGSVVSGTAVAADAPVGTHSLISLLYAMRSFNLKPSKEAANPVNDTRVAVFWIDRPYVFTLRPGPAESIVFDGNNETAQPVAINTGNPGLDQLNIKVWLGTDARRLPLRISAGGYQADLVSASNTLTK